MAVWAAGPGASNGDEITPALIGSSGETAGVRGGAAWRARGCVVDTAGFGWAVRLIRPCCPLALVDWLAGGQRSRLENTSGDNRYLIRVQRGNDNRRKDRGRLGDSPSTDNNNTSTTITNTAATSRRRRPESSHRTHDVRLLHLDSFETRGTSERQPCDPNIRHRHHVVIRRYRSIDHVAPIWRTDRSTSAVLEPPFLHRMLHSTAL